MKKIYAFLILVAITITACTIKTENNTSNLKEIVINEAHQQCSTDSDCINVQTKCNQCECGGVPVNKEFKQMYTDQYNALCNDYSGPQCDVMCALGSVKCIDNRCKFVEEQVLESEIDSCTQDSECMIVPFSHCCGSTKRAINQKYLANYEQHPEWKKFDNPETCSVIGLCADDSNVTEATCQNNKCTLKY